ncbi:ribonuclease PH [Candidatus Saganbacteria bacterium CG08_land_8_20_14_0_20_45_16]|uniref:Ribonuclease PH n=1 Tax=Candidatus Saganbacteria bacterium CG08_land_8_20_14_0_20_45_16 TaxID=2014293 RepID=A0A2H0XYC0_UNCSA|nr:MAG: ribonuclease PH [Candidatus Saganbacteria bacterium CG08_land_8_20_14_0_20_45_16]
MKRSDGRASNALRPVKIERNYLKYPEGSVLIAMGETKVICTVSVTDGVPHHKKGSGEGWLTAEYAMLPRATTDRSVREHYNGKTRGRTHEIQRLIGRSLRAVVDLKKIGERTIYIDADVIQADGGTRSAAITGSFVAFKDAVTKMLQSGVIARDPIEGYLAAVSVGVVQGAVLLDLPYQEDLMAEVDMNVVMTEAGKFVEIQGTAEGIPFSKERLDQMLDLAATGIAALIKKQKEVLAQ